MEFVNEIVVTFGVPIATVIVILKMVFDFINGKKKDKERAEKEPVGCSLSKDALDAIWYTKNSTDKMCRLIERSDDDGTPLVYRKASLNEKMLSTLEQLSTSINRLTYIMENVEKKLER